MTATPHAYAKRLNNPFSGVLQVVEHDQARALSLDGKNWEIQFLHEAPASFFGRKGDASTMRRFARVARFSVENGLRAYPLHPSLDNIQVESSCSPIIDMIPQLTIPLQIEDYYEYWLLDEAELKPLALLFSCRHLHQLDDAPSSRLWNAIPAAQIDIKNTAAEQEQGLPPLSYRLEQLVKKRAGQNPKAQWFKRNPNGDAVLLENSAETNKALDFSQFPEYLLREDWEIDQAQSLCQRYLQRLSPQLLMLQWLSNEARDRAEKLANAFVLDVEKYFHLYPKVADEERMVSIRVEARLRRSLGDKILTNTRTE